MRTSILRVSAQAERMAPSARPVLKEYTQPLKVISWPNGDDARAMTPKKPKPKNPITTSAAANICKITDA